MWTRSRSSLAPWWLAALLLAGAAAGIPGLSLQAQSATPSPLADQLTEIFQPLPLEGGVALVPRTSLSGVRTVEVRGAEVSVNGASVNRDVLTSWLEDSAPPVLELLELPVNQQRALFGFEPIAGPARVLEDPVEPILEAPEVEEAPAPAPDPPDPPQRSKAPVHSDARVSLGDRVVIERNEIAEDIVVIGNSLEIQGEVLGDALAVGGTVTVDGRVSGDVASVGGTVYLEDDAQVHGGVTSIGGGIEREDGAVVFGKLNEVTVGRGIFDSEDWFDSDSWFYDGRFPNPFRGMARIFGGLGNFLFLVLIAGLVLLILPNQTQQVEGVLAREPWKAGLVGLAALLLFWVVLVPILVIASLILVITIIGIPVAVLLILAFVLFTVVVVLLGYTSAALRLGSWFAERFPGRFEGRFVRLLLGILLIEIWMFLASLLDMGGWFLFLPAVLLLIFGWLVEFIASTMGMGAVLTSWYASRVAGRGGPGIAPPPESPPDRPLPPLPPMPSEEELEAEFEAARQGGPEDGGSWHDEIFQDEPPEGEDPPADGGEGPAGAPSEEELYGDSDGDVYLEEVQEPKPGIEVPPMGDSDAPEEPTGEEEATGHEGPASDGEPAGGEDPAGDEDSDPDRRD